MKSSVHLKLAAIIALMAAALTAYLVLTPGHAAADEPTACDPDISYGGVFVGTDGPAGNTRTGAAFDAQRMAKALRDACSGGSGGWAAGSQDVIVEDSAPETAADAATSYDNADVDQDKIRDAINQHQIDLGPDDEFILYISGHGATGANGWEADLDGGDVLDSAELRDMLSGTLAGMTSGGFEYSVTVTVVIDSCEAGGFAGYADDIEDANGDKMDGHHLKVIMSVEAGCPAAAEYVGDDTNEEWYDEVGGAPGSGTESCNGGDGSADDDNLNDAADGDCFGGVVTNNLRDCLGDTNPANGNPDADDPANGGDGDGVVTSHELYVCGRDLTLDDGAPRPLLYTGPVGGTSEFLDGEGALSQTASGSDGSSVALYAAIAGAAAAAVVTVGAGGWYVRRRRAR